MKASPAFLRALGRIVVLYSEIEFALSFLAASLVATDQRLGLVLTSEMSSKNLRAALSCLLRFQVYGKEYQTIEKEPKIPDGPKLIAELDDLLKKAATAEEKRNIVIHSSYSSSEYRGKMTRFKFTAKVEKGLRAQSETMSAAQVNKLADSMEKLISEFDTFNEKLQDLRKELLAPRKLPAWMMGGTVENSTPPA